MVKRITDHDITARFGEIVAEIARSGETLLVERDGEPVLQIGPPPRRSTVADLRRFFELFPPPDDDYIRDVKAARDAQPVEIPKSPWD